MFARICLIKKIFDRQENKKNYIFKKLLNLKYREAQGLYLEANENLMGLYLILFFYPMSLYLIKSPGPICILWDGLISFFRGGGAYRLILMFSPWLVCQFLRVRKG
ncbi:hypothetical protein BpHYR1_017031 [Brachionus plicatilis]|uniref:Uncharacterized protein n=1 Tax=Brachionus plicatilis TaxID=10195 RepID=A0A3M7QNF5_BRAPC|nr:hypothetical protein BpHYR1_017031 [Brachionus plicatilis]